MFKNYILIAYRNLMRNKLYSLINIGGLAIGMAIFIFAMVLAQYEKNHDVFFKKSDRIYTLGSIFSPTANVGVVEDDNVYTTMGPLLDAELPDIEATARLVRAEFLLSMEGRNFYQSIKFTDKSLLKIFDFDYISGNSSALDDPSGIILTEKIAKKYFPDGDAMGKVISLDHHYDLKVTAVIRDFPRNSHFSSSLYGDYFEVFATLRALNKINGYPLEGNWNSLNSGNLTYVLLPPHLDGEWLEQQANDVFQRHASDYARDYLSSLKSRRLKHMNLVFWDMIGWPVIEGMILLAFLVLLIAGLNYTNLATAQALGRSKEVGLRKTLGASRGQLLIQFLVESVATAALAMLFSLAVLEVIIPFFNDTLNKSLSMDYSALLPMLLGVVVTVGLLSGFYPAYVITRVKPVDAMKDSLAKGSRGSFIRNIMIGGQFVFSIFMLAMVAVVSFQNERVKESSNIFPKSQIVTLQRLNVDDVQARLDILKREVGKLPGVENITFSNQVPFEQGSWTFDGSRNSGDKAAKVSLYQIFVDYDFLKTYDIPLLKGRDFSRSFAQDLESEGSETVNVIVNELALKKLGFASGDAALNKSFYSTFDSGKSFMIVGVMADQNFLGLHNNIKPIVFRVNPKNFHTASIRIRGENFTESMEQIEAVWQRVNPDYPIQVKFLDAFFEDIFKRSRLINIVLGGFAIIALSLAFFGLFGLAAFMAARRTREIGIRKVMGAETHQIVTLLIWQFSRPVIWALFGALPLSYFGANAYLSRFSDRIEYIEILIFGSGVLAIVMAWLIVSGHAIRVSRRKPIHALRYE